MRKYRRCNIKDWVKHGVATDTKAIFDIMCQRYGNEYIWYWKVIDDALAALIEGSDNR